MMNRDVLTDRLGKAQQAERRLQQTHAQLSAELIEVVAQTNGVRGRIAELTELLALPETADG